jgi:hypothetical protein
MIQSLVKDGHSDLGWLRLREPRGGSRAYEDPAPHGARGQGPKAYKASRSCNANVPNNAKYGKVEAADVLSGFALD